MLSGLTGLSKLSHKVPITLLLVLGLKTAEVLSGPPLTLFFPLSPIIFSEQGILNGFFRNAFDVVTETFIFFNYNTEC